MSKLYLYMAPLLFYGLWQLVKPFVDPVTKAKVHFLYKVDAKVEFDKAFDPQVMVCAWTCHSANAFDPHPAGNGVGQLGAEFPH